MDADSSKSSLVVEVPESLKKMMLFLVKTFYGLEHSVIADYIQRKTIVKEDVLRDILKIDLKYLRQLLLPLKVDKFIKERLVSVEVDGRAKKINYYFINYKAILNVTKYKLDHMRQKLESREKDEVHRTQYRCTFDSCRMRFEDMDIGKIFNHLTDEMRCWQCGHLVELDESVGPSNQTRNSLALFNEQLSGLFTILQNLDGIRFAQEILEPVIPIVDPLKDNQEVSQRVLRVGERAFNTTGKTRSELYGSGITVSIGDEVSQLSETKEAIPWLQDRQQPADMTQSMLLNDSNLSNSYDPLLGASTLLPTTASAPQLSSFVPPSTIYSPAIKRAKREDIASLLMEEEGHSMDASNFSKSPIVVGQAFEQDQDFSAFNSRENTIANNNQDSEFLVNKEEIEEDDEDLYVMVQGKRILIDSVTDEIVAQMTAEEKETYIKSVQSNFDYYY